MEIRDFRVLRGPNIYCYQPAIRMLIDIGEYEERPTSELGGFVDRLLGALPGLNEHRCSRGYTGGFVERLREGTYMAHVIEHVTLELENMAGQEANYGTTRRERGRARGNYSVVYAYREEEAGILAGRLAVDIVRELLKGDPVGVDSRVRRIEKKALETALGPSTDALVEAASRRGIPWHRLSRDRSLIRFGYGKNQRRVQATITSKTSCLAVDTASDKWITRMLLVEEGIPMPRGKKVEDREECYEFASELGIPVVTKPHNGNQGKGVTLNLKGQEEIARAYAAARDFSDQIIVEENITGKDYRLLVVDGEMVAAARKEPAQVVGDGERSIRELIGIVNQDPCRGEGHEKPMTKLRVDPVVLITLSRQGFDLDSVPRAGQRVLLRENGNLSTGGTAVDVTDDVHPENARLAERASRIIGLDVAGVDLVARDISEPIDGKNGAVVEINAAPGLRMHHYPARGRSRDVAGAIMDYLYPGETESRIPIISVTGTNGKTTTVRLLFEMLRRSGMRVGMTSSDGIYLNGRRLMSGDMTGPRSANTVLGLRNIDAAVLETARGGILREGLGYDRADLGIVTNISRDHLEQDGVWDLSDLADVKSLVVETVKGDGCVVLNADNEYTVRMAERTEAEIIYFGSGPGNGVIREHTAEQGGRAVYLRDGMLCIFDGRRERELIGVGEIPLAFQGRAKHNIENCLAAVAGAVGMELELETIGAVLREYRKNPGRMNVFTAGQQIRVILDYGHNEAGYRAVIDVARRMDPRRLIGVIGLPGDRSDDQIIRVGELSGRAFDYLVFKEDSQLRGREAGEVAGILRSAAERTAEAGVEMETILDERRAAERAAEVAGEGDLIVVFFERDAEGLKEAMKKVAATASSAKTAVSGTLGSAQSR